MCYDETHVWLSIALRPSDFRAFCSTLFLISWFFSNLTENIIQKHFYSAKADELLILFDKQDNSQLSFQRSKI